MVAEMHARAGHTRRRCHQRGRSNGLWRYSFHLYWRPFLFLYSIFAGEQRSQQEIEGVFAPWGRISNYYIRPTKHTPALLQFLGQQQPANPEWECDCGAAARAQQHNNEYQQVQQGSIIQSEWCKVAFCSRYNYATNADAQGRVLKGTPITNANTTGK